MRALARAACPVPLRNRLLVALGLLTTASVVVVVDGFAEYEEPVQPRFLVVPNFHGGNTCDFPGPRIMPEGTAAFVASRFDPKACDLTSEEQDEYNGYGSYEGIEEGVCTALCTLPTSITGPDPRFPDTPLPHSYKFTCTENYGGVDGLGTCTGKGQLAWYVGSDDCDESKIPQLEGFEGALDIKEGDPDTLRTFTFDPADPRLGPGGVPACVESSSTFGGLGLGSFSVFALPLLTTGCPCE